MSTVNFEQVNIGLVTSDVMEIMTRTVVKRNTAMQEFKLVTYLYTGCEIKGGKISDKHFPKI